MQFTGYSGYLEIGIRGIHRKLVIHGSFTGFCEFVDQRKKFQPVSDFAVVTTIAPTAE